MPPPNDLVGTQGSAIVVRSRLLAMIQQNSLPVDGRLPTERDLVESLGVGRRAVRVALDSLDAEGLIWRKQGKGTFAGQPPDKAQVLAAEIVGETNFAEIMEARLCIEPTLAGMAAGRASAEDIGRMRNLAEHVVNATDPDTIELWDGAFHRLIARTAGNRTLLAAIAMIDEIRGNDRWRDLRAKARSLERIRTSDREHQAIIEQISKGNAEGAAAAMRDHLTTLANNLKSILPL